MKKIYSCLLALLLLTSIAHAQTIKPEFPFPNGAVRDMIKYGNTVYIGGAFTAVLYPSGASYPRQNLAAFDATTGALLPWNPGMSGDLNDHPFVQALAVKNNIIYIGGSFNSIGGQTRTNIAGVNPVSGIPTSWNPVVNGPVNTMLVTDTRLYAGGFFLGNEPDNIVVLDLSTGQRVPGFNSGVNDNIHTMALKDNSLFLGGSFTSIGATPRYYIGAVNATNGSVLPWNPAADWTVRSLKIKDNVLFAGGWFSGFGYHPPNGVVTAPPPAGQSTRTPTVVALDVNTGAILPWNAQVSGPVEAIDVFGNNLYVGGLLNLVNGQTRRGVAMVDAVTGALSPWDPEAFGAVYKILADNNTVFVSGSFNTIAGQSRSYFAALTAPPRVPVITCPSNIIVSNATNTCGQLVPFAATATGSPSPQIIYHLGLREITSPYNFPIGTSTVDVLAGNTVGASRCSFTVTVNDTQAPTINNLSVSTNELWPANHKMKDVWIDYTASDNCAGTVTTQLSITSNEPSTGDDWKIIDNHHIQLKAERLGNGNGRIYTITVTARDQYGNTSSRSTTVSVPHDQSKNTTVRNGESSLNISNELLVTSRSNPSLNYFTLFAQSGNMAQKINLRLYDVNGRLLEMKNVAAGETVQMGKTLTAGFYLLQYSQGNTIKQMCLIKQY